MQSFIGLIKQRNLLEKLVGNGLIDPSAISRLPAISLNSSINVAVRNDETGPTLSETKAQGFSVNEKSFTAVV